MNPITNPFTPGAGTPPPELAGRSDLLGMMRIATERTLLCKPTKSVLLVGLRGVGKTVLLDEIRDYAELKGAKTLRIEAPEMRSLPALLAPQLRLCLLQLSRNEKAKKLAQRALSGLAGFVTALKFKFEDIEVGLDYEPEPGLADNGDLEQDLQALLEVVGAAAKSAGTSVMMFVDELQYVQESELEALVMALHRVAQRRLPVMLVGAGLPQLRARMGRAKSYAERLFDFPFIGPLDSDAAAEAIRKPIEAEGAGIEEKALSGIVVVTEGYPYFLQEWGKHAWDEAVGSLICAKDIERVADSVIAALDESFFRVRFDRLTPSEKRYLRAMAELGSGPHRSGDIADLLKRKVSSLAPTRAKLINKGMIWSPSHGDTAFTVPLFDSFMKRIMSGSDWAVL